MPTYKPSVSGRNWGAIHIDDKNGTLQLIDGDLKADGSVQAGAAPILTIAKDQLASSNRRTGDITLQIKRQSGSAKDTGVVLSEVKLAVPKTVHGYLDSADPPKEIFSVIQSSLQGMAGATGANTATGAKAAGGGAAGAAPTGADAATSETFGTLIGEFDDVTLNQPAGLFNLSIGTRGIKFTDSKKPANIFVLPYDDVLKLFMLPAPGQDNIEYGVFALKSAMKFLTNVPLRCVVLVLDRKDKAHFAGDGEEAWRPVESLRGDVAKLRTALGGDANKAAGNIDVVMAGTQSEVTMSVIKAASQLALSGINKEVGFRSAGKFCSCALPTVAKGNSGFLYCLGAAFMFLPKGAFVIPHETVRSVKIDETSVAQTSFDIVIECTLPGADKSETIKFVNVTRNDKDPFVHYCKARSLNVIEPQNADGDSSEDDEEGEGGGDGSLDGDSDSDSDASSYSDSDDDDSDDSDASGKKKKKKKSAPAKKEKKSKPAKKDKSAKKEKKDKSSKKDGGKRRDREE